MSYAIILEGAGGALEVHTPKHALDLARSLAAAGPLKVTVKKDGVVFTMAELERAVHDPALG